MAKLVSKWFQTFVLVSGLVVTSGAWTADDAADDGGIKTQRPGYAVVVADALLVRPVTFIATILGGVVFVATSPITAATGSIGEAGKTLVVEPALTTFFRCLGCTEPGWRAFPEADPETSF